MELRKELQIKGKSSEMRNKSERMREQMNTRDNDFRERKL